MSTNKTTTFDEDGYVNDGLNYYHDETTHNHAESEGDGFISQHQQQESQQQDENYQYPQQYYYPPATPSSYQIRLHQQQQQYENNQSESFFTFINKYEKDEAREAALEKSESNNISDGQLDSSSSIMEGEGTKDDISILLRIYSGRFTPEIIRGIISFLPISLSSLISKKSYQSVFDVTHYKSLYQFGYNNYYSKQSEHIYKRVNATWKETLLELYKMQFREKEQTLNTKFPHPSVKLTQNFMGFVNSEDLINLKIRNDLSNRKLRFTMITYEKYNTSDMFKLFNKNNQFKIPLNDSLSVEYEMNYVGYLLPGSHDFSNFENADAIILTYSVIDFNLFYTLSSWINLLETIAPDVPVILLGTHANYRKDAHIMTKLKNKERYVMRFMECTELAKRFNILTYLEMDACNYVGYEKEISSCSEGEDKHQNEEQLSNDQSIAYHPATTNEDPSSLQTMHASQTDSHHEDDDDVPIETIIDISSDQVLPPLIELPESICRQIHQTLIASAKAAIHFGDVNNEISIRNFWKGTSSFYTECIPSNKCSIQ